MARQARGNKSFVAIAVMLAVGGVAACNAILGNESAVLGDLDGGPDATFIDAAHDGAVPLVDGAVDARVGADADANVFIPPPDATSDGDAAEPEEASPPADAAIDGNNTPTCTAAQKLCAGTCVSQTDPAFGCGPTSCDPCALPHATSTCTAGVCAVATCDSGYGNCDLAAPGCESDLSLPAHCGQCTPPCAASAPICAKVGTTPQCTTGCTADAPTLCGGTCADLQTSPNHCGSCNIVCPGTDNGQATCRGRCGIACNALFHPSTDGRSCLSNNLPTSCGPTGKVCTGPAGSTVTCDGTNCGFTCGTGLHQCPLTGPPGTVFTCAANNSPNTCGGRCDMCQAPPANGLMSTCDGTNCGFTCQPNFVVCGGVCLDSRSPQSCGDCSTSCPGSLNANATCNPAAPAPNRCGLACAPGFADCDGQPGCEKPTSDFATDPANCGGCGMPCMAPSTCANGTCTAPVQDAATE